LNRSIVLNCHTPASLAEHVANVAARITPDEVEEFTEAARVLGDQLSLWNRFAIWTQRPNARHVADLETWHREHLCELAPDAVPLAIVSPNGRLTHVYDRADVRSLLACQPCPAEAGEDCEPTCPALSLGVQDAAEVDQDEAMTLIVALLRGTAQSG
jgi:hypothetical protein